MTYRQALKFEKMMAYDACQKNKHITGIKTIVDDDYDANANDDDDTNR